MPSDKCYEQNVFRKTWLEYSSELNRFLASDEKTLFLRIKEDKKAIIQQSFRVTSLDADLIQFCSLRTFQRGELGIRELHWLVSESLTKSRSLQVIIENIPSNKSKKISMSIERYQRMLDQKKVNSKLLKDLGANGILISDYIEPQPSNLVLSRDFASALIEFNSNGYLSLERAVFALARSSRFRCYRILGI
jgi:hypothetical protein